MPSPAIAPAIAQARVVQKGKIPVPISAPMPDIMMEPGTSVPTMAIDSKAEIIKVTNPPQCGWRYNH